MKVSVYHPTNRPNFCNVSIGDITLYFSYETCIAFRAPGQSRMTIIKNYWGPTTGKHLNYIDPDATKRLDSEEFEKRLNMVISPYLMNELVLA